MAKTYLVGFSTTLVIPQMTNHIPSEIRDSHYIQVYIMTMLDLKDNTTHYVYKKVKFLTFTYVLAIIN